jgi:hypothetical protein
MVGICAQQGEVIVELRAPLVHELKIAAEISEKLEGVEGLEDTHIRVMPTGYASW